MNTNVDYWEKILKAPSPAFSNLFVKEKDFLISNTPKDSKVLDIGCGDGRNIVNMLNVTKDIVGLDNDPQAIHDAQRNLADFPSVQVILGNAFDLPFEDKSFDVVTLMMTLVNFEDRKLDALKEMKRVLKKDGSIMISVYSEHAFNERVKMYTEIGLPFESADNTKVIFDKSVGANVSEQFTEDQLKNMAASIGLSLSVCEKVGEIAYLCKMQENI